MLSQFDSQKKKKRIKHVISELNKFLDSVFFVGKNLFYLDFMHEKPLYK